VLRHTERADAVWSCKGDVSSAEWVCDPPLSDKGLQDAQMVAKDLLQADPTKGQLHVVVSSPYMRCVQTAVQVCLAIGPTAFLLLDNEVGEVYGPDVFGEREPSQVLRPMQQMLDYCASRGVHVRSKCVGQWPRWPEPVPKARARFLDRFLRYLRRSITTRRNFVLVTHADGVAAALSAMPATRGRVVNKVDFGGFFYAHLQRNVGTHQAVPQPPAFGHPANCRLPLRSRRLECVAEDNEDNMDTMCESDADTAQLDDVTGWEVVTSNIELGPSASESLVSKIRRWSKRSDFSEKRIAELLGCLPHRPMTDVPNRQLSEVSTEVPAVDASESVYPGLPGVINNSLDAAAYCSDEKYIRLNTEGLVLDFEAETQSISSGVSSGVSRSTMAFGASLTGSPMYSPCNSRPVSPVLPISMWEDAPEQPQTSSISMQGQRDRFHSPTHCSKQPAVGQNGTFPDPLASATEVKAIQQKVPSKAAFELSNSSLFNRRGQRAPPPLKRPGRIEL